MTEVLKRISELTIKNKMVIMSVKRMDMPLGERIAIRLEEWLELGSPLPGQTLKFTIEVEPDV